MKRSFAILLFAPTLLFAQAKQPINFDRFLALKIVGDPQLSPDGGTVAFTVTEPSLQENRSVTRIWVVPASGGSALALTHGPGSDFAPRWAPDGRSLGFVSTRANGAQVWRVGLAGENPVQLTKLESGVNDFLWAKDGKAVFVTSDLKWPPGDHEIDKRNGEYQTQARIWTGLFYRVWNEWREGIRSHLLRINLADNSVKDLTPVDHDTPPLDLGAGIDLAPSGTELALVMNPDAEVAQSTNNDVFSVGTDGTSLTPVTTRRGNDHSPAYAPDGRSIAYLSMETPGFEADRQQLMLFDRSTQQHRALTADWDVNIQSLVWTPDSKNLILEVEERGAHDLYRFEVATGKRAAIATGGLNTAIQVSPRGDQVVFLRQTAQYPPEVFRVALDGTGLRQLTSLNTAALAQLDLPPLESFSFVGALGDSVQAWLLKPPAFNPAKKYPLIYVVHGGPQVPMLDSWSLRWNYQMFAARGYVVSAVNFHGSPGWGQRFTNSISQHWGDYPFEDLMKGLDRLAALPYVDSTRMAAAGASYGGYMVNWLQGHTNRFKVMVSHDGIFDLASAQGATEELWFPNHEFGAGGVTNPEARALLERWSPSNFADQWNTPMLVIHGQLDYRLELAEGLQAFTALKVRGIPAKFLYFPDEGHWVLKPRNRRLWWGTVLDWIDQYLKPTPVTP